MSVVAALVGLAMPFALGAAVCRWLGVGSGADRAARLAWCWMAGCLALGAELQLLIELRVPPAAWAAVVGLSCAAALVVARRRSPGTRRVAGGGRLFVAFALLGAALCLWFALAGMDRPCVEGDEGNIWSLKAKSLLVDFPDRFAAEQVWNLHADYPQLNPLLQAWFFAHGAPSFDLFANRVPIQVCDVALFLATITALRHRVHAPLAILLGALLLCEPVFHELLRTAYADGMVALGVVVALDAWLRWRAGEGEPFRWLAGLGLAFALWSKNEAMLYAAGFAGALVLERLVHRPARRASRTARRASRTAWLALLPAFAVVAYTALWNRRFGMQSDLLGANPTGKSMFTLLGEQWPERTPAMAMEALRTLPALDHAHAAFFAVLGVPFAAPRLFAPAVALLASWVGLHVIYAGSFLPLRFHLDTSYLRVTFQLLPAALVLLAAAWADVAAARRTRQTAEPA